MAGLIKKVVRAAVAQPWDYMGEGAPTEWEFRISPEEDRIALWNPAVGRWVLFHDVTADDTMTQAQGEKHLAGWARYVEELDDDE